MIQELLAKYRNNAEAKWAKGNIMATPETVGPSGTGQEAKISVTQIPKGHSFLLQRSCWNSKLKSFAHKSLSSAKSNPYVCRQEGCAALHWQAKSVSQQHPHELHQGKSQVSHVGAKNPVQQFRHWQAKQHLRQEKGSGEQEAECVSAAGADCSAPSKSTARSFTGQTIPF